MDCILAEKVEVPLAKGELPGLLDWEDAEPVAFCSDWRGENEDPQRETQVRALWSGERLFFRFLCRYKDLYIYEDRNSRRDKLWLRDVAEVFIQREQDELTHYREFEISPNGDWLDLDICNGGKTVLYCDLLSRVSVYPDARVWVAELGIPLDCLTPAPDPAEIWKLNFFRIEGQEPSRFYSAWQPTYTPKPNFHAPECFAELHFNSRPE